MKFNIEIELDYLEEGGDLNTEIKQALIYQLSQKIEREFLKDSGKQIALAANKLITAKTELIINTVLEKPVIISDGWHKSTKYNSLYEMIEQKMTRLYEGKLNVNGTCTKDPLLANLEKYIDNQVSNSLHKTQALLNKQGKLMAIKAVEENGLVKSLKVLLEKEVA